jgi:hypothetical protein
MNRRIHCDLAAYLANAAQLIFKNGDKPEDQLRQAEQLFRDAIFNIEQQIAADRKDWS